jgi:molecular chaperone IbpA
MFELLDELGRNEPGSWPPYNIEKSGEDRYRITMAVAGFSPDDIELVQRDNELLVSGKKAPEPADVQMLHRGIATRAFKQNFNLADHVKVTSATLENGLLTIELLREVPDALKPRRIAIGGGQTRRIEQAKAA